MNVGPLRIGTGKEPPLGATVDLAVVRTRYRGVDLPYIPGSSLKGTFRSAATALAVARGFYACSGLSRETCMDTQVVRDPELGEMKLGECIDRLLRQGKPKEAMEKFWEKACLLCKMFGSPGYSGKIHFSDAHPISETGEPLSVRLGARTGIAIDRRTGAVFKGALYTVEYVEPGAKFKLLIRSTNLPNYSLGLLASVFRMVHLGQVKLGGFKTRGFGEVRIEDLRFEARDYPAEGIVMRSLEPGVDEDVDLSGLAELKAGWLVARGDRVWRILEKFEEVWNHVRPSR